MSSQSLPINGELTYPHEGRKRQLGKAAGFINSIWWTCILISGLSETRDITSAVWSHVKELMKWAAEAQAAINKQAHDQAS
jgi:hypothetical protein